MSAQASATSQTLMTLPRRASYWQGGGMHRDDIPLLRKLIPISGEVANAKRRPALERYRKAANAYYDLWCNGGGNRPQAITALFGKGTVGLMRHGRTALVEERTEPVMDAIIADAIRECGLHLYWATPATQAGNIVATHRPQRPGAAEGDEGVAEGLRLRTDGNDGSWSLWRGGTCLAAGTGATPTVSDALALEATNSGRNAS